MEGSNILTYPSSDEILIFKGGERQIVAFDLESKSIVVKPFAFETTDTFQTVHEPFVTGASEDTVAAGPHPTGFGEIYIVGDNHINHLKYTKIEKYVTYSLPVSMPVAES